MQRKMRRLRFDPEFGMSECCFHSSGPDSPEMPDEILRMYDKTFPLFKKIIDAGMNGTPLYDIPKYPGAPKMPSAQGMLSDEKMYAVPHYNVGTYDVGKYNTPSVGKMMPSKGWIDRLDPGIKEGLWAPFQEANKQMVESMGDSAGAASGGWTGAGGVAQGQFWEDAGKDFGTQAWGMVSPALQRGWEAELGRSRDIWEAELGKDRDIWGANLQKRQWDTQQQLQKRMQDYKNRLDENRMDYSNWMTKLGQDYAGQQRMWETELNRNTAPFSLVPSYYGAASSSPFYATPQQPSPWGTAIGSIAGYVLGGPFGANIGSSLGGFL